MCEYIAEIKEVGNPSILKSSLIGQKKTKEELIAFWGLADPDVEWYHLYEVVDGRNVEM